jgi:hypothetical protein
MASSYAIRGERGGRREGGGGRKRDLLDEGAGGLELLGLGLVDVVRRVGGMGTGIEVGICTVHPAHERPGSAELELRRRGAHTKHGELLTEIADCLRAECVRASRARTAKGAAAPLAGLLSLVFPFSSRPCTLASRLELVAPLPCKAKR